MTDPRVTWLVTRGGDRLEVVWPPGYTARFTGGLEVVDSTGIVVFREGDAISGGCKRDGEVLIALPGV